MGNQLLERLIKLRKRAKLSCRQLSLKIHRHENYMSRVENGDYQLPPIEDLEKIVEICGSSMRELFHDTFETYCADKDILEMLRKITSKDKNVVLALLVLLYEKNIGIDEYKGDKE